MVSSDAHVGGRDGSPPRTDELGWDEFEDYVEDVLSAHRFSPGNGRRIASVTRWGRRGDKPDGIDLKGNGLMEGLPSGSANGIEPFRLQM